jgi:hypothetical protein
VTRIAAHDIWRLLSEVTAFVANLLTIALGVLAVYGITAHREQIRSFLRLVSLSQFHKRFGGIKESLGRLESLNCGRKRDRIEVHSMLGQLVGQLQPLIGEVASLKAVHDEILQVLRDKIELTEPEKRRIVHGIRSALDVHADESVGALLEPRK